MSGDNWKTLRVPPEAYDDAKEQKEEHGRTWGEQIVRDTDDTAETVNLERLKNELSMANEPGVTLDMERVMDALETVEERTGRIERTLEDVEGRMR